MISVVDELDRIFKDFCGAARVFYITGGAPQMTPFLGILEKSKLG